MVQAIPKGYHAVTPFLMIKGAAKAIEFYKKAFDAKEISRLNAPDGTVGHAEIEIGDSRIMVGDVCEKMGAELSEPSTSPLTLYLYVKDVDKTAKQAEAAGGKLEKPLEDQFYGDRSGKLVDPFGFVWWLATHVEDVAEDELDRRMRKAYESMDKKSAA